MCRLDLNKAIKIVSKSRPHKVAISAKGLLGSQALSFPDQTRPPPKALLGAASGVFAGQAGLRVEDVLIPSLPNHLPTAVSPPLLLKDSLPNESLLERQLGIFFKERGLCPQGTNDPGEDKTLPRVGNRRTVTKGSVLGPPTLELLWEFEKRPSAWPGGHPAGVGLELALGGWTGCG